jgi:tetratricopeptide (TPR) repeat protein
MDWTDSLIYRFSQLPNLKVSPTSSVMRYKGSLADVSQIANDLDVDAVLSGRLTQIGDDLAISVQLIEARTKKLIWAEQYDRKMSDFMSTQREIATTLTQKMQLKLAGDEKGITKKYIQAVTKHISSTLRSLSLRESGRRTTCSSPSTVIRRLSNLIQILLLRTPRRLRLITQSAQNPSAAPKDAIPLAKAAATRALELDPMLPEAHSALADSLTIYDWNWAEAERHFRRALELDPNLLTFTSPMDLVFLTALGRPRRQPPNSNVRSSLSRFH